MQNGSDIQDDRMKIREAIVADAAPIARVMVHTFLLAHRGQIPEALWQWRQREWTPEFAALGWERDLRGITDGNRPHDGVFVAESESGEIVGVIRGEPAASDVSGITAEITALYVHPHYQGEGIGRRLLQAVAVHLAARGMTALQVGTLVTNAPARRFYEAMGAQVVAERAIEDGGHPLREVVYGWPDIEMTAKPRDVGR